MNTLDNMKKIHDDIPKRDVVGRLKSLENIQGVFDRLVYQLQQRNNELIVSETVMTQQVGLLMEQRFMLITVLSDIKASLESEGRENDPMVHMMFNVINTIRKMDDEWQEKIGDKSIKDTK